MNTQNREFTVTAKFKDGKSQRIGTFTSDRPASAIEQASKALTDEQRKKLDQWEVEEDFL